MGYRGLLLAVSRVLSLYIQYKVQVGVFIEQNSLVHILCSIENSLLYTIYPMGGRHSWVQPFTKRASTSLRGEAHQAGKVEIFLARYHGS